MTIVPVRGVGDIGVIADLPSYDLPLKAWASARNVRFRDGVVTKSGAFKALNALPTLTAEPAGILDASNAGSQGYIVVPYRDGAITQVVGPTQTNVSPTPAWTAFTTKLTSCKVGGVTYINNNDNRPIYRSTPTAGVFSYVPGWPTDDRALSLRAFKDYVIGLNITKAGVNYPNMVKWSAAVSAGSPPADWDVTSLSSHAGENVLNDAAGKLIDGVPLGNSFILYGNTETYLMSFIGTPLIFSFDKLFDDLGVLSQDCAVEVDGKHYVFGSSGIYVHDGQTKLCISDRKVTKHIYSRLDQSKATRCHVWRNPTKQEVIFAYPSIGSDTKWGLYQCKGCNEGAVYNITTGSWSFIDLPSTVGVSLAAMPALPLWSTLATWDTLSTIWTSFEGSEPPLPITISTGGGPDSASPRINFYDDGQSGFLANPIDSAFVTSSWMETSIRDSDEMGSGLATLKLFRSVHPQIKVVAGDMCVKILVGVANTPYEAVSWSPVQEFFPATQYKADFRKTGRYVTLRFEVPSSAEVEITGYDFDIDLLAMR